MKILFSSNAPWVATGYGNQAKLLLKYLKQDNDITFLANFGLSGNNIKIDDVLYLPSDFDWGNETIAYIVKKQKPDAIITLADWFVFKEDQWNNPEIPWLNWTPLDFHLYKNCEKIKTFVENCAGVVPMSQFGYDQISAFKEPLSMIHHALDPDVFKIIDKQQARKVHAIPEDAYVLGFVMANQNSLENRKAFDLQIEAASKFMKNHPELNVMLYFHTEISAKYKGNNLIALLKHNDVNLEKVIFTHPLKLFTYPFNDEQMLNLYNSFDVLMNASSGEGFGVPIIEAQACGVPVLTHDSSAMSELTFYGYAAKSNPGYKRIIEEFGYRFMPEVSDIVQGLEHILETRSEEESKRASEMVREKFAISKIAGQWTDTIAKLV